MGIDRRHLNDQLLRLIAPAERKQFGKAARTMSEIAAQNDQDTERDLHNDFVSFLRRNRLGYYHCDPTKKSTIEPGTPDFGVYREGRILFVEFKVGRNDLSEVQQRKITEMIDDKNVVFVCRDYATATELTRKFFHLPHE